MGYVEDLLGANEQVVVRTRRHWIVLASTFFSNLAAAIAILLLFAVAGVMGAALLGPLASLAFLILLLLVFPLVSLVRQVLDWWNEEYLITNRRVIQSEGVINKHVIDSSLEKVNDVVLVQSVGGRLLDYGDIEILTASEIGVNKLQKITSPIKFKTAMLNAKAALGGDESFSPQRAPERDDVPGLIAQLDELRKRGVLTEEEFQQKKEQLLAKM